MSQSCETLITKINEWQKAILELEELSEEFLNTGDEKLKPEIDAIRQETKKLAEEYQELAYPELLNGQNLFWLEKELLEELIQALGKNINRIKVKNKHLVLLDLIFNDLYSLPLMRLSLFKSLEEFIAPECNLEIFPQFPKSIKVILINDNRNIKIPEDLSYLDNLEVLHAFSCNLKILSKLSRSIKYIMIQNNPGITNKEKERIKKEHPNAIINF